MTDAGGPAERLHEAEKLDEAEKLYEAVLAELPTAIALRHAVHSDPRLSGVEEDTRDLLLAALDAGPAEPVADTGALVRIGARSGPCVAVRTELDALPLVESTGVAWASTGPAMHACGHDVHMAGLVAFVRAARAVGVEVPVLAVLQPREEVARSGAIDLVASGALHRHDVRAVIGAHVQPRVPAGVIAVTPGATNAAADQFEVVVSGRGGHGGYPQTTADPVLALAGVIIALQQVVSRRVDPVDGAVCTVGTVHAGSAFNVIPDTARAGGSLRCMDDHEQERLRGVVRSIAEHTAAAHGCSARVDFSPADPVLRNDPALATATATRLRQLGIAVDPTFRSFGADDFAHYCKVFPSVMTFVGTGTGAPPGSAIGSEHVPGLHHPRFVPPDDTVGEVAMAFLAGYLATVVG